MMRLDDIFAALPEIGFSVWRLDMGADGLWHAVLEDTQSDPLKMYAGDGATARAAVTEALTKAGVNMTDDGA